MIDIHAENLLPLSQAAKLPCFANRRNGRPISACTLARWALHGVRGVKLETVVLATRMTSAEAIARFSERLSTVADGQAQALPPPLTTNRQRQIEAAEQRLGKASPSAIRAKRRQA